MSGFYYLAAPYGHVDPKVIENRMEEVAKVNGWLIQCGIWTMSPLFQHYSLPHAGDTPGDYNYWKHYSRAMVPLCKVMLVITLPGWRESGGVQDEIKLANELGIPVWYICPHTYCITRVSG